jgi:hypothetical protein
MEESIPHGQIVCHNRSSIRREGMNTGNGSEIRGWAGIRTKAERPAPDRAHLADPSAIDDKEEEEEEEEEQEEEEEEEEVNPKP